MAASERVTEAGVYVEYQTTEVRVTQAGAYVEYNTPMVALTAVGAYVEYEFTGPPFLILGPPVQMQG